MTLSATNIIIIFFIIHTDASIKLKLRAKKYAVFYQLIEQQKNIKF